MIESKTCPHDSQEIDATEFESDSVYHRTKFYRLSDGWSFEQEENDSLMNMLKH